MRATVDAVGRLVIPKALRVALGIGPETELDIVVDGSGLRLEPLQRKQRVVERRDGLPILGGVADVVLTDEDVRRLRDDLQR